MYKPCTRPPTLEDACVASVKCVTCTALAPHTYVCTYYNEGRHRELTVSRLSSRLRLPAGSREVFRRVAIRLRTLGGRGVGEEHDVNIHTYVRTYIQF